MATGSFQRLNSILSDVDAVDEADAERISAQHSHLSSIYRLSPTPLYLPSDIC